MARRDLTKSEQRRQHAREAIAVRMVAGGLEGRAAMGHNARAGQLRTWAAQAEAEYAERGERPTAVQVRERVDALCREHCRRMNRLAKASDTARFEGGAVAALEAEGEDPTPEAVGERVAVLRSAHMRWVVSHRTAKTPTQ